MSMQYVAVTHHLSNDIRLYFIIIMASSSDPGGEGTWLRPKDMAYLLLGSAAEQNDQVQVISRDHPQN
jgi:hypothetical protein